MAIIVLSLNWWRHMQDRDADIQHEITEAYTFHVIREKYSSIMSSTPIGVHLSKCILKSPY